MNESLLEQSIRRIGIPVWIVAISFIAVVIIMAYKNILETKKLKLEITALQKTES